MKIFLNHLSRSGGTSMMSYFRESYDGKIIVINTRTIQSDSDLINAFNEYMNEKNVIVIGHTHQPSLANRRLVYDFWHQIYSNSRLRISVLRNPIERSLSWIKVAGCLGTHDKCDDGIGFTFRGATPHSLTSVRTIEKIRGSRSKIDDNIYECIMPDNFYADHPDNINIATSLNNYPIELLSKSNGMRWLTPMPLRSQSEIDEYTNLFKEAFTFEELAKYMQLPSYDYFSLESIDVMVRWFEDRGITRKGFCVPHINSMVGNVEISLPLKRRLLNLYPESYLLWKHAASLY